VRDLFSIFLAIIGFFLVIYILIPIALMISLQLLDLNSFLNALGDELVLSSLANSVLTSTATMIISLLFGVPLGYILARSDFYGKSFVQAVIDLPIVIPHSVVGIMLLLTFSSAILDNYLGIIAAMLFVSASFTINSAKDGFTAVEERTEFVARTLGASRLKAFLTVSLPLAMHSIITGAIMTWARAMSEVGAILIVAYYPKTAQVLVMDYFNNYGLDSAKPIAVILIMISLLLFITLRRVAIAKG
jgi:molybdate/tungstate transport system permease protein